MIRYLGVDWGEKRVGLALADSENKVATPFKTVSGPQSLLSIIESDNIDEVVIGHPIKMSGQSSDNQRFLQFVQVITSKLKGKKVKVILIDERMSSLEADSRMNKKINNNRDSLSAMIILQSFLDKKYD